MRTITYMLWILLALLKQERKSDRDLETRIRAANHILADQARFSTSRAADYDELLDEDDFRRSNHRQLFLDHFPSHAFFGEYVSLGFPDEDLRTKDINTLSQGGFLHHQTHVSVVGKDGIRLSRRRRSIRWRGTA